MSAELSLSRLALGSMVQRHLVPQPDEIFLSDFWEIHAIKAFKWELVG